MSASKILWGQILIMFAVVGVTMRLAAQWTALRLGYQPDLCVAGERLTLFVRFWLTVTPPLPEGAQAAAQAKGRERFALLLESLGRRLAKGQCVLREISRDDGVGRENARAEAITSISQPGSQGGQP